MYMEKLAAELARTGIDKEALEKLAGDGSTPESAYLHGFCVKCAEAGLSVDETIAMAKEAGLFRMLGRGIGNVAGVVGGTGAALGSLFGAGHKGMGQAFGDAYHKWQSAGNNFGQRVDNSMVGAAKLMAAPVGAAATWGKGLWDGGLRNANRNMANYATGTLNNLMGRSTAGAVPGQAPSPAPGTPASTPGTPAPAPGTPAPAPGTPAPAPGTPAPQTAAVSPANANWKNIMG